MRRLRTILFPLVLAAGLATSTAFAAPAGQRSDGGDTNAATVSNTTDGSSLFRFAWAIRHDADGTVDETNEAYAYARCSGCRTVAIAFEIVLVNRTPTQVTPQNVSVALNDQCTSCDTYSAAYQFVVGEGDGALRFAPHGMQELQQVRRDLRTLDDPSLSLDDLNGRVSALADEVRDVLANDLVAGPGGPNGEGAGAGQADESDSAEQSEPESSQPTGRSLERGRQERLPGPGD